MCHSRGKWLLILLQQQQKEKLLLIDHRPLFSRLFWEVQNSQMKIKSSGLPVSLEDATIPSLKIRYTGHRSEQSLIQYNSAVQTIHAILAK